MAEAAYRLSIANNVTWGFGTAATLSSEAYMHLIWGQWAVGTQSGSNQGGCKRSDITLFFILLTPSYYRIQ